MTSTDGRAGVRVSYHPPSCLSYPEELDLGGNRGGISWISPVGISIDLETDLWNPQLMNMADMTTLASLQSACRICFTFTRGVTCFFPTQFHSHLGNDRISGDRRSVLGIDI